METSSLPDLSVIYTLQWRASLWKLHNQKLMPSFLVLLSGWAGMWAAQEIRPSERRLLFQKEKEGRKKERKYRKVGKFVVGSRGWRTVRSEARRSKEKSRGNYPSKKKDFCVNLRMLRLMKCTELALNWLLGKTDTIWAQCSIYCVAQRAYGKDT